MPESINEQVADEIRAHAIDFERFAADVARRVLELLLLLETELVKKIRDIDPTEPTRKAYRDARLAKLLEQTRASIREGYKAVNKQTDSDLIEVAEIASTATVSAVNSVVGVELMTVAMGPEKFRALVDNTMIEGAPSKDWWSKQAGDTVFRFQRAVQQGYAQGETVDQIVKRVRGTNAANYRDGIMEVTRRNATSLVHTSVQAVSNSARREVFSNNSDIIFGTQQISTLDSHTCVVKLTPINMADGTVKSIADIQAGEMVLGGSLMPRKVLGTKKATTNRLARITFDDGRVILCTPDHLFLTQENAEQIWIEAQDLLPNTEFSCKLNGIS